MDGPLSKHQDSARAVRQRPERSRLDFVLLVLKRLGTQPAALILIFNQAILRYENHPPKIRLDFTMELAHFDNAFREHSDGSPSPRPSPPGEGARTSHWREEWLMPRLQRYKRGKRGSDFHAATSRSLSWGRGLG